MAMKRRWASLDALKSVTTQFIFLLLHKTGSILFTLEVQFFLIGHNF